MKNNIETIHPKVSILMSVYNEPQEQIEAAVESILEQTYHNFELIIINDAPKNQKLRKISQNLAKIDSRITIIYNEKNLGLALSMNKAAATAKGEYIARMDADDISHKERIQREVEQLDNGADFAYTNYHLIDETGKKIHIKNSFRQAYAIKEYLPLKNCIIHSSIIIKNELFKKLGGYRNFPCAQDYDLWLRVMESNAKIVSLSRKFISYRIRANSISMSMPMKQDLTANYIKQLHHERLHNGKSIDSFSLHHYQQYLQQQGLGNKKKEQKYIKYKNLKNTSREKFKKGDKIKGLIGYAQSFLANKLIRQSIVNDWKIRRIAKNQPSY